MITLAELVALAALIARAPAAPPRSLRRRVRLPHRGRAAPGSSQVLHPCGTARSAQPSMSHVGERWCVSRQN